MIIWQVGNVEIADIRWKLMHHLTDVHPAKKNASSSTTPVIPLTVNLKALTSEYDSEGGFKWSRITAVKSQENYKVSTEGIFIGRIY